MKTSCLESVSASASHPLQAEPLAVLAALPQADWVVPLAVGLAIAAMLAARAGLHLGQAEQFVDFRDGQMRRLLINEIDLPAVLQALDAVARAGLGAELEPPGRQRAQRRLVFGDDPLEPVGVQQFLQADLTLEHQASLLAALADD